jgi:hypothetical protein
MWRKGMGKEANAAARWSLGLEAGSTLGSPGLNRIVTLLLLLVLGATCFDPRSKSRSGAIA